MSWSIAKRLFPTAVPIALATVALAIAVLTDRHRLALLLAAGLLGVLGWSARTTAPTRLTAPARVAAPARTALRLVLAATALVAAAGQNVPLLLAGVLLVGLLQVEAPLYRAGRPLYRVANLVMPRSRIEPVFDRRAVAAANTLLLAALILVPLAGWPGWAGWPVLGLAGGGLVLTAGAALLALRRRVLRRARSLAVLRRRVAAYRPTFMVYFTAPPGSAYQLTMWLPQLARLDERFVVVLRERNAFDAVARTTAAPVIYAPELGTFDATVVESLRVVYYVNNGAKNGHCVRYGELVHVFLNHGDSDKPSSFNPVATMYDLVFVAGQAGVDRYLRHGVPIPLERFRIVGRPQVAGVRPPEVPVGRLTNPTVLYAPTWTGHYADANYSSLPIATAIVRALLDRGATVILRHHPYSNRNRADAARLAALHRLLAADTAATGRRHVWGEVATTRLSLVDCFNRSDALIGDVSSVASEYLYSEKPFAITDMAGHGTGFAEAFPLAAVGYVVDQQAGNLPEVLDQLLVTDPRRDARLAARTYYLGDIPRDRYADAFVDEARRAIRATVSASNSSSQRRATASIE